MTTRNLTASVGSLMSEPNWGLRVLAHVTCASSTLYIQTGIGYLAIGANTYAGVGQLGGLERVREDLQRFSPGVKMWLSAASGSNLFAEVMSETLFNRDVLLYRAFLRDGAIVNTPELWFRGKINQINLYRDDPERGDYMEVECRTRIKKEHKSSYYTREDLWLTYSGDTGFDYLAQIPGYKGLWGLRPTYFGPPPNWGNGPRGPGGYDTP